MNLYVAEVEFEMKYEAESMVQAAQHFHREMVDRGLSPHRVKVIREIPEDGTTWIA